MDLYASSLVFPTEKLPCMICLLSTSSHSAYSHHTRQPRGRLRLKQLQISAPPNPQSLLFWYWVNFGKKVRFVSDDTSLGRQQIKLVWQPAFFGLTLFWQVLEVCGGFLATTKDGLTFKRSWEDPIPFIYMFLTPSPDVRRQFCVGPSCLSRDRLYSGQPLQERLECSKQPWKLEGPPSRTKSVCLLLVRQGLGFLNSEDLVLHCNLPQVSFLQEFLKLDPKGYHKQTCITEKDIHMHTTHRHRHKTHTNTPTLLLIVEGNKLSF